MPRPGKADIERLFNSLGGRFSAELGIDLSRGELREVFKWFLASKLMGARISTVIAIRTYKEFERHGVTTPERILKTGWDGLVRILDDGGYVRYDFSTATRLLEIAGSLKRNYGGDLNKLHQRARDEDELETQLKNLGKGIGEVTVNIFLWELRGIWEKARPVPTLPNCLNITKKQRPLCPPGSWKPIRSPKSTVWPVSLNTAFVEQIYQNNNV